MKGISFAIKELMFEKAAYNYEYFNSKDVIFTDPH